MSESVSKHQRCGPASFNDLLPLNILYESKDFLIISKPPDLRMDGEEEFTLEKLLAKCYPNETFKWVSFELFLNVKIVSP